MDELALNELHESTTLLGNWHEVNGKTVYLCTPHTAIECLLDIEGCLKRDTAASGYLVRLKLGQWKIIQHSLINLIKAYRDDSDLLTVTLRVCSLLTVRVQASSPSDTDRLLVFTQDYKELFLEGDIFNTIMSVLLKAMEENEVPMDQDEMGEGEVAATQKPTEPLFDALVGLVRNIVSVPDPRPGDGGFTMSRRHMQMSYIKLFHDHGFFDFVMLLCEHTLESDHANTEKQAEKAWVLGDIIYHICTQVDPDDMCKQKEVRKKELGNLLEKTKLVGKPVGGPAGARHSRFGTVLESRNALGGLSITTQLTTTSQVTKGKTLWRKEFKDASAKNEKKRNMFHDPFFVDLEEGSVREHNRLNPLGRHTDERALFSPSVLLGLKKFFMDFLQNVFKSLIQQLRSACNTSTASTLNIRSVGSEYNRPKLMNIVTFMLEFHRNLFKAEAANAKKSGEAAPVINLDGIQAALDLDMLQFVTARLRQHGKEENFNTSALVVTLRTLQQQLKTTSELWESSDQGVKELGDVLAQQIVKADVNGHLTWILKNFKPSAHDPRILSYTIEIFYALRKLMKVARAAENPLDDPQFVVEVVTSKKTKRKTTTAAEEIAALADVRVIDNLFHLLEKYQKQSSYLHQALVKLIYEIVRANPSNIVVLFELTYFMRIFRIVNDPAVLVGKQYSDMRELLQWILRQFFKCAEGNGLIFVELFFRKAKEDPRQALLDTHAAEWSAILDNYEDETYKHVLDRVAAGESISDQRAKHKAVVDGKAPWTAAENQILRDRYPVYGDHPLVAELLAAELPEENRRNARQVRKQLQDMGLIGGARRGAAAELFAAGAAAAEAELDDAGEPAAKRPRVDEDMARSSTGNFEMPAANFQQDNSEDVGDIDLERLLDAAIDSDPFFDQPAAPAAASTAPAPQASTQPDIAGTRTAPDVATCRTAPDLATCGTAPVFATVNTAPDLATANTMPDIATMGTAPDLATAGTIPDFTTTVTAPDHTASAAAPAASQHASEADDDEQAFWDNLGTSQNAAAQSQSMEMDLEKIMEEEGQNQAVDSQSLEMDLEKILEEGLEESQEAAVRPHSAEEPEVDLERDLEQLMEEEDDM